MGKGLVFCLTAALCMALVPLSAAFARDDEGLPDGVFAEINRARTDPQRYADYLREFRRQYRGRLFLLPGSRSRVRTVEGVAAVDEAIRFLSRQKPLPPLAWVDGLADAAQDLVAEEGATGTVGHTGRQSGSMRTRIERHGRWRGRIGENISYGPAEPQLVVMELIVDDGVQDRGHRKNIFDPIFRAGGVACGPHPEFRNMCVIDFAGGFSE
ncbi:MAG TPA: CAP domain-containing protein [Geobacteraceae bacterium]|nr:CAP domain-containing protein [Geobacteraceae bacterium]